MQNNTTSQIDSHHQCVYREQMETITTLVVAVIFVALLALIVDVTLRQFKK